MALGDPYAELAKLKKRVALPDSDVADDDALTAALDVASRGIESCTHRQFNDAGAASARVYHPVSHHLVKPDDFSTTEGLVVETDAYGNDVFETTWASAEFTPEPLNGVVNGVAGWPFWRIRATRPGRYFPCGYGGPTVRVTARWGWAAVPSPVKEATLILAEDLFKLKDTPFGAGGYAEYGRIRARENPNVWLRIMPYVRDTVLVG